MNKHDRVEKTDCHTGRGARLPGSTEKSRAEAQSASRQRRTEPRPWHTGPGPEAGVQKTHKLIRNFRLMAAGGQKVTCSHSLPLRLHAEHTDIHTESFGRQTNPLPLRFQRQEKQKSSSAAGSFVHVVLESSGRTWAMIGKSLSVNPRQGMTEPAEPKDLQAEQQAASPAKTLLNTETDAAKYPLRTVQLVTQRAGRSPERLSLSARSLRMPGI